MIDLKGFTFSSKQAIPKKIRGDGGGTKQLTTRMMEKGVAARGFNYINLLLRKLVRERSSSRQVVDEAVDDDNSVICFHPDTIDSLQFFHGDTILIKGKKQKDAICIVVMRHAKFDLEMSYLYIYALIFRTQTVFTSFPSTILLKGFGESISYIVELICRIVTVIAQFCPMIHTNLAQYCVVAAGTEFFCEGEPVRREDEDRLDEVSYDDVGGIKKQITQIRELVEFPLRYPQLFKSIGLLTKPELSSFALMDQKLCPKWLERVTATLGRLLKKNAPSIIFMDEIDSIAPKHEKTNMKTVSQFLTLMDGLQSRAHVIVIGATNRPNSIDPALRRLGTFDKEIEIGVPDVLRIHTKNMKLSDEVDLERIANDTHANDDSIDADILNSMAITNEHFQTAHGTSNPSTLLIYIHLKLNWVLDLVTLVVEVPNVSWEDIGGFENVKRELQETVQYPVEHPEKFEKFSMSPSKGCQRPELLSMWFGESEANVREIFDNARQSAPCGLFFYELGSIAIYCSGYFNSSEMDGMSAKKTVFIIHATNRPDIIDPALLRPGRLDQLIYIPLPDEESRYQIFKACLRKSPGSKDVDLSALATYTQGFSGADITEIYQRACKYAIRGNIEKDIEKERRRREDPEAIDEERGCKNQGCTFRGVHEVRSKEC
ncbi:hypothetical protein CXB51_009521 [Gossypium anomalum]|uniref:ATPase AAA-type core domain-containing protein n=1 Tax=Gossypium anomalum TaxID=47600 RepID=A0A8J5YYP2_9ROSI|nr:hypothetical protein CXB51_009521 [Gossypium anomalum]